MKKLLFPFLLVFSLLITISCEKNEDILSLDGYDSSVLTKSEIEQMSCGESKVVPLMAGQNINVGSVTISNDKENLYVVYETTEHWYLQEVHLFVGAEENIPVNGGGNPVIGHFPYSEEDIETQSYVFTIPLYNLDECFSVVTHAVVSKILYGETSQTETAFGCGDKDFSGNRWGCYTDYCVEECDDECLTAYGVKYNLVQSECLNSDYGWSTWLWLSYIYSQTNGWQGHSKMVLYANIGDECDITEAVEVGEVQISTVDGGLNFKYVLNEGYTLDQINLYVGDHMFDSNNDTFVTSSEDSIFISWDADPTEHQTSMVYITTNAKVCSVK